MAKHIFAAICVLKYSSTQQCKSSLKAQLYFPPSICRASAMSQPLHISFSESWILMGGITQRITRKNSWNVVCVCLLYTTVEKAVKLDHPLPLESWWMVAHKLQLYMVATAAFNALSLSWINHSWINWVYFCPGAAYMRNGNSWQKCTRWKITV